MAEKIILDADKVLKKKFNPKSGGYDALEVDKFLDDVRTDYTYFIVLDKEAKALVIKNEHLTAKNVNLEALNLQLTRKIKELERLLEKSGNTMDNLRKIDKYERQLWALGIDPRKAK